MEPWLLLEDADRSPFANMAFDELLLSEAAARGKVILRFYGWTVPAASFGYSQSPEAVPRKGLVLVRRPTGGGIVYHDNDLTYTLAVPHDHAICRLDRMESYLVIHEAVMKGISALGTHTALMAPEKAEKHDRATLQCFVSPSPHDIMAESGAKLAGAAQRRTHIGILHQGSIAMAAAHGLGRAALIHALERAFSAAFQAEYLPFVPAPDFLEKVSALAERKYSTDAWNHDKIEAPQS